MSLLPYVWRELYDEAMRPSRILDQHFGLGLTPEDLFAPLSMPALLPYRRGWRNPAAQQDTGSTIIADKDKFQVNLDVQQFKPEEITVKAVDNSIVIEGKHEERKDEHGFISRQFTRRYVLPEGHDINAVASSLSSDGVLTITAPKKAIEGTGERVVPITHTGPTKPLENKATGDQK